MVKIINREQILKDIYEEAKEEDKLIIKEMLRKINFDEKISEHLKIYIDPLIKKYCPSIFD